MSQSFDLIVIGAGPGGYVAAIRGAQLGMNVAIVEKEHTLGGTCLNWGCIPSKALLDSSEHYYQAKHQFEVHGITVKDITVDIKKMMARKAEVVAQTTKGIDYLMSKNKITKFQGLATFKSNNSLTIAGKTQAEISANHIIIATGSEVASLPTLPIDGKRVISSKEALELTEIPKHLVVIGGGVIGVELGSVFARLGSKVTVIEFMDRLIPTMDKELGKTLEKSVKKLGFTHHFKTKVTGIKTSNTKVTIEATAEDGEKLVIDADYALVSIGRRPNTDGLGLDKIGVKTDERGRVDVDSHYQTNIKGIYAIGDVIKGPMLAHKASEEGVACVETIAGHHAHMNYNTIPGVVYTWPEVASVGKTEEELKAAGASYKAGKFPFKASGRARAAEESEGFVKVLADATTDEILGVHMIGPRVSDMIGSAVIAMEYRASAEDIGMMIAAHPTFSEAIKEAALDATEKRAIHF
jgi:dihydrolipoamide dehydrogenase